MESSGLFDQFVSLLGDHDKALADARAEAVSQRDRAVTAETELEALKKLHANCSAPETPAVRTQFGACPRVGSHPSSVVRKFGPGAAVRMFNRGGLRAVSRPEGAGIVHVSWKPPNRSSIDIISMVAAFTNLRDGDLVEVWHEADVKYRKGDDLTKMLIMKNRFHDLVVRLREAGRIPQVLTVNTWAGWSVDETSPVNPWDLHCQADLLGLDMDGLPPNPNFYPFAERQMGAKFVDAYRESGYVGWTIPEFTMAAVHSDPSRRIEWFTSEVGKLSQGLPNQGIPAPRMIAWFDTDWPSHPEDESLHHPDEIAAWSALVARS